MFLKRALGVGLLALTGVAVAQQGFHATQTKQVSLPAARGNELVGRMYSADDLAALRASAAEVAAQVGIARKTLPKKATAQLQIPNDATGRIIFKVADEHQALLQGDGQLLSLTDRDLGSVGQVIEQFGLTVRPGFNKDPQLLVDLQRRATAHSGKGQPWLAGMLIAEGPAGSLLAAARALNDLDAVEWVEVEARRRLAQDPTGACCLPNSICSENVTAITCQGFGGEWQGPGTTCGGLACGACCLPAGSCSVSSPDVCAGLLGDFQGAAVPCEPTTCDLWACCLPDFSCVIATTATCSSLGGVSREPEGVTDCGAAGSCGACCFGEEDNASCADPSTQPECEARPDFIAFVPNATCNDDPDPCADLDPDCGVPGTGDCYDLAGNGSPYCDDEACCTRVCDFDPFCCDEMDGSWDRICAAVANQWCLTADHCNTPANGDCFDSETCDEGGRQIGCNDSNCCNIVCAEDEFCCDDTIGCWDADCVALALALCQAPTAPDPDTPEMTVYQGYRSAAPYNLAEVPDYIDLLGTIDGEPFIGYTGEGYNLMDGEPWDDLNGNGVRDPGEPYEDWNGNGQWERGEPEIYTDTNGNGQYDEGEPFVDRNGNSVYDASNPYGGLYGLGQYLLDELGVDETGQGNLTLGKTIKVAVIEWAYWEGHEDLNTITEPGQTLIPIPEVTEPDHATACLSIIDAKSDAKGFTGLVPASKSYFFPLTSAEEGPRELDAWASAIATLGPGDVISCSYGPGVNLNNVASTWTMIRMASDTGIISCIAATNGCLNLDLADDFGDSGGIVVGACSPGDPWYRLPFSNYHQDPLEIIVDTLEITRSNVVHVRAWGDRVAAAGYGTYQRRPPDPNRRYTLTFGGSSAATPQTAGAVASLQGLAKQLYGIPLSAEQIRYALLISRGTAYGSRLFGGFGQFCTLDLSPDEGPNFIGTYPSLAGNFGSAASRLLNINEFGFDENPLVDEIQILVGTLVHGNVFSIKKSDNNHLIISSELTTPGGSEVDKRGDIISGNVTDVLIHAHTRFPRADSLAITTETFVTGGAGVVLLYIWNWDFGQWMVGGVGVLEGLPDERITFELGNADQFIQDGSKKVLFRIQTVSGAFGPNYEAFHDEIRLDAGGDPQVPSDGP